MERKVSGPAVSCSTNKLSIRFLENAIVQKNRVKFLCHFDFFFINSYREYDTIFAFVQNNDETEFSVLIKRYFLAKKVQSKHQNDF